MDDFKKAVENRDLHMNNNNKNTKENFKTDNTLKCLRLGQSLHTHLRKERGIYKRLMMYFSDNYW